VKNPAIGEEYAENINVIGMEGMEYKKCCLRERREKRGEGRGGLQIIQICFVFSNLESTKKKLPHHTPLFRSHFSPPSSPPSPPQHPLPSPISSLVYPNPSSKNPTKDHKKTPKLKSQRIHHPNLKAPRILRNPPPKRNKTVTTRQEALGHMKKKKGGRTLDVLKKKKGRR